MSGVRTVADALLRYEVVIGLEVHAQLDTRSKLFSSAPVGFDPERPNENVSPYCFALPGTLPVPNAGAVRRAIAVGVALGMEVHVESRWARKHYTYPDLPKGYQITQAERPICTGGALEIQVGDAAPRLVPITRMHLEEDAGKSTHDGDDPFTRVDLNRAGTPLVELVTAPALRSGAEAAAFLRAYRAVLLAVGASRGTMEEGSLRADVNVSLRPHGQAALGTRVELKNLSSFRFVEQAVEHEVLRQGRLLADGEAVVQETRLYDPERRVTRPMRAKEEAEDYRYVPDPDLPPLRFPAAWIDEARDALPELPAARHRRWVALGAPAEAARVIGEDERLTRLFDAALAATPRDSAEAPEAVRALAQLVANELARVAAEEPARLDAGRLAPPELAALVELKARDTISSSQQKKLLAALLDHGGTAAERLAADGAQVSDDATLAPLVDALVAAHPSEAAKLKAGKQQLAAFFVGQIMKQTRGKANPERVRALLDAALARLPS